MLRKRDAHRDGRAAAIGEGDLKVSLAHHLEPRADVFQGDMGRIAYGVVEEARTIVFDNDLVRFIGKPSRYADMDRLLAIHHPMLHRILDDWLKGEGRKAEKGMGRIEFDEENVLELRLLDRKIRLRVL